MNGTADDLEVGLLAAIRDANADDDGPKRVFMDWLLERADPRGEFLRLALAPDAPVNPSTQRWAQEMHSAAWAAARDWEARLGSGFTVRADGMARGFLGTVAFSGPSGVLARRLGEIAPLLVQDTTFNTYSGTTIVRRDQRVLANIFQRAKRATVLEVVDMRSRAPMSVGEHELVRDPSDGYVLRGVVLHVRFAPDADDLHYDVDNEPQILPFVLRS